MWRATLKGLAAHKLRLVLTALAVVLGVAFVSGTYVFTDTINRVFDTLFGEATEGVDVFVRAETEFQTPFGPDREPMPEALLDTVQAVDGVAVAVGAVDGFAQFVAPDGEAIAPQAPTLGVTWTPDPLTPLRLRDGRPPTGPGEVVMDAATASAHDFAVGQQVSVITVTGAESFELVGIAGFGDADNLAGATLAAFELREAQRLFDLAGQFTSIEVAAAEEVSATQLRDRISAVLPAGVEAAAGSDVAEELTADIGDALGFLRTGLLVFAAVALFVGAFIIANTFSIVVAQRTREFALLRALGASGRQVTVAVLAEAAIVGTLASAVGVAVGVAVAVGLRGLMGALGIDMPSGTLVVAPRTVVVGIALGLVITVVSAVAPARRAARVAPLEALRAADAPPVTSSRGRNIAGVVVTVAGAGLVGAGLAGLGPNAALATGLGALVVFLGVALLSPLIAGRMASILGAPGAGMGMPGRLAQGNARRNPRRTAATASALMIGLALVGFVAIFSASLRASAHAALEQEVRADFILQGEQARVGAGFSPALGQRLAQRPELSAVSPMRFGFWRKGDDTRHLLGIDPDTIEQVQRFELIDGSLAALDADSVLVSESVAAEGTAVGERIEMRFARTGTEQLEVAGVFEPTRALGVDHLLSLDGYDRRFSQRLDNTVFVKAAPGVAIDEARAAVEAVSAEFPGVPVTNQAEFRERQDDQIGQLLALVTALLLLAIVIALLGITNTLALSVFERTREIGLLRAVGMSRRQTRAMIRWEAMIVAVIGALIGIGLGVVFGWAVVRALADEGLREFDVPVGQLVLYVVVAALAGVVAGVLPARRAAGLDVLESIATE